MSATLTDLDIRKTTATTRERSPRERDRRRFTIAVVIGIAVVTAPYLWTLWDMWSGGLHPLRAVAPGDYYDIQARALVHGHLYVPKGSFGIEAFVYGGHEYTYFGIFPALVRIPFITIFGSLYGRLTAPSLLVSWLVTGIFTCLLIWRVRHLVRGPVPLGRREATCYGVLAAVVTGGSVLVFLAATPYIYNEDMAWSVALTIGSLFALLGVLERPSRWRVLATGALILATNLDRPSTGYACALGAFLVAGWLALGRRSQTDRRWAVPMAIAGLVPLIVSAGIAWAKFRAPFGGYPLADQVWTQVNAHRRYFLSVNGGKPFSLRFLPSTLEAYFQPAGLHFTSVFPFITFPVHVPHAVGDAVLEQTQHTASIPASMPVLFLLSCWGVVAAFRPRGIGNIRLTRLPLIAGAAGGIGILLFGFIFNRYSADLLPFLILASAVGLVDALHRSSRRSSSLVAVGTSLLAALGLFSVVVNVALAASPNPQWTAQQAQNYVTAQRSVTPAAQKALVIRDRRLPYWAPINQLYVAKGCSGLYLSTGFTFWTTPGQQVQHWTWIPVEQAQGINTTVGLTFNVAPSAVRAPIPLLRFGASTLVAEPAGRGLFHLRLENPGVPQITWPSATGWPFSPQKGVHYQINVMTDPNLNSAKVTWYQLTMIWHYLGGKGPAQVLATPSAQAGAVTVSDIREPPADTRLCTQLSHG